ncbi:zinc-type alcohol dehydrogenase [Fusarium beomiforme]|uniref:Zinc-type alcohol dehydrogenase n=1 Tax=Fusarium beomiforme TaxID=44412 RepID=A0A9P5AVY9_9HYPO|nr:zinc-type alcohol dehydrogenase [Fusarium beomiforme]
MYVDYMERWIKVASEQGFELAFVTVEYRKHFTSDYLEPIANLNLEALSTEGVYPSQLQAFLSGLSILSGIERGCNVWFTRSNEAKLRQAKQLGVHGGVFVHDADWDKKLLALMPASLPYIDAIIDGAGGDIVRLFKTGGAVMKNIDLCGSTMGSRVEFRDMVAFVRQHRIKPVVSRSVKGLDNLDAINSLFEDMRDGKQFGKLVIEISSPGDSESTTEL